MNEMLNFTQKAFSSQLRQKQVKSMRYQPTMPNFPSQMNGIQGGSLKMTPAQAEHDAKTRKL